MKILLALVLGVLCTRPVHAQAPSEWPVVQYQTPFKPPAEYRTWYAQAEQCAGLHGNFDAIEWRVVPTPWRTPGGTTYGEWRWQEHGKAVIVVNALQWRDSLLVMHESLHDIMRRNGFVPRDTSVAAHHPVPPYEVCAPTWYPWPGLEKQKELP